MDDANQRLLIDGAANFGVDLGPDRLEQIDRYLALLEQWSRVMNLTAVKGERDRVVRLILDSLAPARLILGMLEEKNPLRVIDIGSGAGVPGAPLAIAVPGIELCLCESRKKRAEFLREVVRELKLSSAWVEAGRAEVLTEHFDLALARAVGSVAELAHLAHRVLLPGARLILMKGPDPRAELDAARSTLKKRGLVLEQVLDYDLPEGAGARTLVVLTKKKPTNE